MARLSLLLRESYRDSESLKSHSYSLRPSLEKENQGLDRELNVGRCAEETTSQLQRLQDDSERRVSDLEDLLDQVG